jgi:CheY-like chemotaxis protein
MKMCRAPILIVEDNDDDQLFIMRAFEAIGVTDLVVVESGKEAIAYINGEGEYADRQAFAPPALIVTELKIADGDGFEVLQHLRSDPSRAAIPAVVLSGSIDPNDIKKSYELGASSFHVKPNDPKELQELLSVLHAYWLKREVPEVDATGKHMPIKSGGKLGERFDGLKESTRD